MRKLNKDTSRPHTSRSEEYKNDTKIELKDVQNEIRAIQAVFPLIKKTV